MIGAMIAGSLVSGILGDRASRRAERASNAATDRQINELRRQFDLTRADTAPYREAGRNALRQMMVQLGLEDGDSTFTTTPGYEFRVKQGQRGVDNYLARQGMRLSGPAIKAVERFRQGTAADEYGNYFARLGNVAGFGPAGVRTAAASGARTAAGINSAIGNNAIARMNAAYNRGSAWNNAIQGGIGNWLAYDQNRRLMNMIGGGNG